MPFNFVLTKCWAVMPINCEGYILNTSGGHQVVKCQQYLKQEETTRTFQFWLSLFLSAEIQEAIKKPSKHRSIEQKLEETSLDSQQWLLTNSCFSCLDSKTFSTHLGYLFGWGKWFWLYFCLQLSKRTRQLRKCLPFGRGLNEEVNL